MKVVTASQMRELDRQAIEETAIPGIILMENAGLGVVEAMEQHFHHLESHSIAIICGKGNNGGDGFVVARHLANQGMSPQILLLSHLDSLQGDARINAQIARNMGIEICEVLGDDDIAEQLASLGERDIIVDAIFGTGLERAAEGFYAIVINLINSLEKPVVAVDIPSGLFADSPNISGAAIRAELTVTFGLPKLGLLLYPAASYVGDLYVAEISIPKHLIENADVDCRLIEKNEIDFLCRPRAPNSHKGNYGHVLIIAGSPGKTGAAILAAEAAQRIGAGLVTVAVPRSLNQIFETRLTEVMTLPLTETNDQTLGIKALDQLLEFAGRCQAIVIGPGSSTHPQTSEVIRQIIREVAAPCIVDADALSAFIGKTKMLARDEHQRICSPLVITPHPGEMGRLLNLSSGDVLQNRIGIARQFATEHQVWLVLKSARTLIADPLGKIAINTTGNPGMASGGSGDVLSGLIGGLMAQGNHTGEAVCGAVYLHGACGDQAAQSCGERFLSATDLIRAIPETLDLLSPKQPR